MSRPWPIVGAGLVVIERGRVLLVRRKHPPRAGAWSLPGGKQAAGEMIREASAAN
ncbi:MAG: NUDIX domain-containing protein [Alphaproteobacteria bacterium]